MTMSDRVEARSAVEDLTKRERARLRAISPSSWLGSCPACGAIGCFLVTGLPTDAFEADDEPSLSTRVPKIP